MKNLYENLCFALSLMFAGSVFASEHPVYSEISGELDIPTVTVGGTPGVYQDVRLKFEDDNHLRMHSVSEGVLLQYISQLDVFQTDTFPVQVFLEITGDLPDGCSRIGQIRQYREDNSFNVRIYFENEDPLSDSPPLACTQALVPFKHIIPLEVYGLQAGTYEYELNEEFSGSFSLDADNSIE